MISKGIHGGIIPSKWIRIWLFDLEMRVVCQERTVVGIWLFVVELSHKEVESQLEPMRQT